MLTLLLSLMTAAAGAAGGELVLEKDFTLTGNGTYTVELTAYATGTTVEGRVETGTPLDVVLVADQSAAMESSLPQMKAALHTLVEVLAENGRTFGADHRAAIVGFSADGAGDWTNTGFFDGGAQFHSYGSQDWDAALLSVDGEREALSAAIDSLTAEGPAYAQYGMELAYEILRTGAEDRSRMVVVVSAGQPGADGVTLDTASADAALTYAERIKTELNAEVYTVDLGDESTFLNGLSSNYVGITDMTGLAGSYTSTYAVTTPTREGQTQYYVLKSGTYYPVFYAKSGSNYWNIPEGYSYYNGTKYTKVQPKQNSYQGSSYTLFYLYSAPEQAADHYCMTAADPDGLSGIFDLLTRELTTLETWSEPGSASVLREVLAGGFALAEGGGVEVWTVPGTTDGSGSITWGEAAQASGLTVTTGEETLNGAVLQSVRVTGFDYAGEYIGEEHPGTKLVVKLTGVTGPTGTAGEGRTAAGSPLSGLWTEEGSLSGTFPIPTVSLTAANCTVERGETFAADLSALKLDSALTFTAEAKYGTVELSGGVLTYTPSTMLWDGADTISIFGRTTDESLTGPNPSGAAHANAGGYLWTTLTVAPADHVDYGAEFSALTYTGTWSTDGAAQVSTRVGDTVELAFTGTGVELCGRTGPDSGIVAALLYRGSGETQEDIALKTVFVDERFESGQLTGVPTVFFRDLPYGTYTVKLIVGRALREEGAACAYTLEGVRVYDPMANGTAFTGVRELLLEQCDTAGNLYGGSAVFIDRCGTEDALGVSTTSAEIYAQYGPKNEVYLAPGQSILFRVDRTGADLALGLRAPQGTGAVSICGGADLSLAHTAERYYAVTPDGEGLLSVTNRGDTLLAVTKVRVRPLAGA